ncbi:MULTISPECIES: hypothetical protein [unclassified Methanoregula]|uniref:hypothetical protein n=1 Tax=unclassified Methanoregula TaxID=2649730 RepID=UPI0009D28466|nr:MULTISPECIES: hypothetical protein [unclassified Methanoregula]OPX64697.1 MAG: hypothetical protein A4E33_00784 [Methanoregula sp. PtaB.Bin085]OPY36065.1 MAG: hypothetical protein A4E34_00472 [Methanoregula sp. PtaU1.Bin006]
MPDTDLDGLIDSIDPDPLDAGNNTMSDEMYKSQFIEGLFGSDATLSDPRHRNEAFEYGQAISQFACIGSARDFMIEAGKGHKGPYMFLLAVGSIPEGKLLTSEVKFAKWVTKLDDVAERAKWMKVWIKASPTTNKVPFAKRIFPDEIANLEAQGVSPSGIATMVDRGIDFSRIQTTAKAGDDFVPIEWTHTWDRHVTGKEKRSYYTTLFPMNTQVDWGGKIYPGKTSMTDEELKQKIIEIINEKMTSWPNNRVEITKVFDSEWKGIKEMKIYIDENGLATAFPTRGTQIYYWNNYQWIKTP